MTSVRMIALSAVVVVVGCGRTPESAAPEARVETATTAEAHADASQVKIEAVMLRDLRITTATVESRRGDEQVTLLGELAVDERAYAEVATPVGATVLRMLAELGDDVGAGQPLLELQSAEVGHARSAYLTSMAQLALAESALSRKRDLAAERIAPQREVQEAEAAALSAREEVRAASSVLAALGLPAPEGGATDSARSSVFTLHSPIAARNRLCSTHGLCTSTR